MLFDTALIAESASKLIQLCASSFPSLIAWVSVATYSLHTNKNYGHTRTIVAATCNFFLLLQLAVWSEKVAGCGNDRPRLTAASVGFQFDLSLLLCVCACVFVCVCVCETERDRVWPKERQEGFTTGKQKKRY